MARSAFTLLEGGRPQAIAASEPRVLERLAAQDATAETLDTGVATNENPLPTGGRTLAVLIDDAGIEPPHMTYVARALCPSRGSAGEYDLTLDVIDNASGRSLTERARFSVEPPRTAARGESPSPAPERR
jgi:hypothetical protein